MADLGRRSFLTNAGAALIASPAIVRASSLMKIKPYLSDYDIYYYHFQKLMNETVMALLADIRPLYYDQLTLDGLTKALSSNLPRCIR